MLKLKISIFGSKTENNIWPTFICLPLTCSVCVICAVFDLLGAVSWNVMTLGEHIQSAVIEVCL